MPLCSQPGTHTELQALKQGFVEHSMLSNDKDPRAIQFRASITTLETFILFSVMRLFLLYIRLSG